MNERPKDGNDGTHERVPPDVTVLLRQAGEGTLPQAQLFEMVYDQLRAQARAQMNHERSGHTLQPTVLVHEAWLRLGGNETADWQGRAHFFGAAGEAMRRILVEHARKKGTAKRGGGLQRLPLDALELQQCEDHGVVMQIDEALSRLETFDERLAQVVRLRFWAGLDEKETAKLLQLDPRTVRRDWKLARAWLTRELEG